MEIRNISTWLLHLKTNTSEKLEQVMACKRMADVAAGYRMLIFVHIRYMTEILLYSTPVFQWNNSVTCRTVTICAQKYSFVMYVINLPSSSERDHNSELRIDQQVIE